MINFKKWLENKDYINTSNYSIEKPVSKDAAYPAPISSTSRLPQKSSNPDGAIAWNQRHKKDNYNDMRDMHYHYKEIVKNLFNEKTFEFMVSIVRDIAAREREYVAYKPFILDFIDRLSRDFRKNYAAQMFLHYFKKYIPTLQSDEDVKRAIDYLIS